ncbi:MAG: hypothetical protein WD690_12480 [Vicinamibacterales bacterium]
MSKPCLCAALVSALLLGAPVQAAAQNAQGTPAKRVLSFLAGGAAGLVAHEAGHLAAGLALDADPGFKRLDYGIIPFFVVTHDPVSRRREYVIAASGFFVQHAANGRDGVPEPVIGMFVLVPATLDAVRYLKQDPAWARWTSRAVKAGLVLLAVK